MSSALGGDVVYEAKQQRQVLASGLPLLYASIVEQSHSLSSPRLDNDCWSFQNLNA